MRPPPRRCSTSRGRQPRRAPGAKPRRASPRPTATRRLGPADPGFWACALACQARFRAAGPLYVRAVEGHLAAGAPFRAARPAVSLGLVEVELGHGDAARVWIDRAEELLGADGPPPVLAFALWLKSRIVSTEGDQDEALALAGRAVALAAAASTSMRALVLVHEDLYRMALGDVAAGRARQDRVAAAGLSSEVDPLTGTMIYCSILWTCRTFADWSRAAQWTPGFDLWCKSAFAEVTSACRLHGADVLASVGRLGAMRWPRSSGRSCC